VCDECSNDRSYSQANIVPDGVANTFADRAAFHSAQQQTEWSAKQRAVDVADQCAVEYAVSDAIKRTIDVADGCAIGSSSQHALRSTFERSDQPTKCSSERSSKQCSYGPSVVRSICVAVGGSE